MLVLKAHDKKVGKLNEIDKSILVPKKNWGDFELGEGEYKINGKSTKLRVYDVLCDCDNQPHTHRILDLRSIWDDLGLKNGDELEIGR